MNRYFRAFALVLAAASLGACDDSTSISDTARLQLLLTDAPSDYVAEAWVDIGAVELLPVGDGERIILSDDGTDGPIDLLNLQGLTTQLLADLDIPAGSYRELRMIIESASVTLTDPYMFNAGGNQADLSVPSGATSGLKLKLRADEDSTTADGGVEIAGGQTVLVVDFDVNQSFRIQGNPNTPAGINSVSFRPTLRVVVQDVAGSISGTLSTTAQGASVGGLVVNAETVDPGDNAEYQSAIATAVADTTGAYTIYFLAPGDYTVTVTPPTGLTTTPSSVDVTVGPSEDVTGIDFEIVGS